MSSTDASRDVLTLLEQGPVLLYDGECGVCAASVQWVLAHERTHTLRFSALQGHLGTWLRATNSIPADIDSLLWARRDNETVVVDSHSRALIQVLRYVGGPWQAVAALVWLIPKFLRDAAYRAFARRRHLIRPRQCLLPTPEERSRFVDSIRSPAVEVGGAP